MKNISNYLLVLVLNFSAIFFSCSKNEKMEQISNSSTESFAEKKPHWASMSLYIIFGHNEPPHFYCIGTGICEIGLREINNTENISYPIKAGNSLVVYFEKSSLDSQGIDSFHDLEITVYENIPITDSWIEDLGFKDDYTIISGTYVVIEETDYYVVRF